MRYLEPQTAVLADWLETQGLIDMAEAFRSLSYKLDGSYLIRTATNYWVGKIVAFTPDWLILEEASWIPDTGRFHLALRDGLEAQSSSEIEPVDGFVRVNHQFVVDVCEYNHPLPRKAK